jgi:TPR repeat protein
MKTDNDIALLTERAVGEARRGDYAALLTTHKTLAALGDPCAHAYVGLIYETGEGEVEPDINLAIEWYRKGAIEFNDAYAHLGLGRIYSGGYGVKQDFSKAHDHYYQAFLLQRPEAAILLGVMYLNGKGVERDISKARKYFEFAASLGYFFAMARLLYIERMSPEWHWWHLPTYMRGLKFILMLMKCFSQNPSDKKLYGFKFRRRRKINEIRL